MKIWRLGQIHQHSAWQIFRNEKKLSFDYLKSNKDFSKIKDFKGIKGRTCIKPFVSELKKGDLIIIMNKHFYADIMYVGLNQFVNMKGNGN